MADEKRWPQLVYVFLTDEELKELPVPEGYDGVDSASRNVKVVPMAVAEQLYEAARPYHDLAAPHEEAWSQEDYRNFNRLVAALDRYEREVDRGR